MLRLVSQFGHYAECCYPECCYAECQGAIEKIRMLVNILKYFGVYA